jgi:translation initiation factor IF-2
MGIAIHAGLLEHGMCVLCCTQYCACRRRSSQELALRPSASIDRRSSTKSVEDLLAVETHQVASKYVDIVYANQGSSLRIARGVLVITGTRALAHEH